MIQERIILSPGLIVGLALLAVNDFFWKDFYHNWFTGKLSDFAGLWSVSLLSVAIVKARPRTIFLFWACSFIFWKSSSSQPFIDYVNGLGFPKIGRVTDSTDLIAISIIPFALSYAKKRIKLPGLEFSSILRKIAILSMVCVSFIFTTATQMVGDHLCCDGDYEFKMSKAKFLKSLKQITGQNISPSQSLPDEKGDNYFFDLNYRYCDRRVFVNIQVAEEANITKVHLNYIHYNCKYGSADLFIQDMFEKEITKPIQALE